MNNLSRLIVFIFLGFLTVLIVNKGFDLLSLGSNVDGDGIGIYFLGMEINDRVAEESIATYAVGFFVAALITILMMVSLFIRNWFRTSND